MKTKITFISVVTLSIALLLTSCSGKGTEGGTGGGQKPERCAETGTGRCERPA